MRGLVMILAHTEIPLAIGIMIGSSVSVLVVMVMNHVERKYF